MGHLKLDVTSPDEPPTFKLNDIPAMSNSMTGQFYDAIVKN